MTKNNTKPIFIKGAYLNNLKHIDVIIPKNKLTVITGVSGSGKSTLAFNTLYAEGQRRYIESLSSYARQFLGKLEKPLVEDIKGLAPAIAIQQKVISSNPRSTVGTSTEIYDYLKLLFARIGKTYSPISNEEVSKSQVHDVIDYIKSQNNSDLFYILTKLKIQENFENQLKILLSQGYQRLEINGKEALIEDLISFQFKPNLDSQIFLIIDRFEIEDNDEFFHRLSDSVQTAFYEGEGELLIKNINQNKITEFSNSFEKDNIVFTEPSVNFFSFNNPLGACKICEGYGTVIGIDENLVIPNKSFSIYEKAVKPWESEINYLKNFINKNITFPIHKPYYLLSKEEKKLLWYGNNKTKGIYDYFKYLSENSYKIQNRMLISKYTGKTTCHECEGKRLRKETNYVKINDKNLMDLVDLNIEDLLEFFNNLKLTDYEQKVAKRILFEIKSRLSYLLDVGLKYLTLNRASNTLSGGESQRINLATSLGSSLVGSIYILDEPSIGLHSKDTEKLINILKKLRDNGNTVVVVEHDEDIMKNADYIIDIGPNAGVNGGEVVFQDYYENIKNYNIESHTLNYLNETEIIEYPRIRRNPKNFIKIRGARENNLKNIDVDIPTDCLTVISGVSGSGKGTLLKQILFPHIHNETNYYSNIKVGEVDSISNNFHFNNVEFVDQNSIGKSSRSNPITYIKAYDDIRNIFATLPLSKQFNYSSGHFSFNVEGGRCEKCKGEGVEIIEMQFMADLELTCEECHGKRFKKEILEVKYKEKSIYDILNLTVLEALEFFKDHKRIYGKILPLKNVGLEYLKLGQSSNTLSGGEAQRLKLAFYLTKGNYHGKMLFIFDEPSTGLHFHDIKKLLNSFDALIDNGHSIIVIEHHPDIIKYADWIIDIGPDAGKYGGEIVAFGTPENVAKIKNSFTGKYLKQKLKKN